MVHLNMAYELRLSTQIDNIRVLEMYPFSYLYFRTFPLHHQQFHLTLNQRLYWKLYVWMFSFPFSIFFFSYQKCCKRLYPALTFNKFGMCPKLTRINILPISGKQKSLSYNVRSISATFHLANKILVKHVK